MRILAQIAIATILCSPTLAQQSESSVPGVNQGAPQTKEVTSIGHYNRGVELHKAGFVDQALSEYQLAVEEKPEFSQAWGNMAAIYMAQSQFAKAVEAYEKALAIEPRAITLDGLGAALNAVGRTDEAMELWRQAIKLEPNFSFPAHHLAHALDRAGRYDEARAVRKKAGWIREDGRVVEPADYLGIKPNG